MTKKDDQPQAEPQETRPEFKFQVLQQNLAPALGKVARAVATKSTLPVLSNILVVALPEGRLRIAATNLEIAVVAYVPAKVEETGGTTLPASTFVDLTNALPEEELLRRLKKRNSQPSQDSFLISEEAMKPWIAFFQKPALDELERRV